MRPTQRSVALATIAPTGRPTGGHGRNCEVNYGKAAAAGQHCETRSGGRDTESCLLVGAARNRGTAVEEVPTYATFAVMQDCREKAH